MTMKRRDFLKTSVAATSLAGVSSFTANAVAAETGSSSKQEYYELRVYTLKNSHQENMVDEYLGQAAIPAWNRIGIKPVGVFKELNPSDADTAKRYVLIPYDSLELYGSASAKLREDNQYLQAADAYLNAPPDQPPYDRISSQFMLAFAGMPQIELPPMTQNNESRIFELRTYESYSEKKARKKVDMFNDGEIDVMKDIGMGPVFYGQKLIGPRMPNLTYMLSAPDMETHKKHWGAFGSHPGWVKMKDMPEYADTVSNITNVFLAPTDYSQI